MMSPPTVLYATCAGDFVNPKNEPNPILIWIQSTKISFQNIHCTNEGLLWMLYCTVLCYDIVLSVPGGRGGQTFYEQNKYHTLYHNII
jgi:hypothetical protein